MYLCLYACNSLLSSQTQLPWRDKDICLSICYWISVSSQNKRQAFCPWTVASAHSPTLVSFLPTVDRYGSILTKLLFCFMHLADEVDEAFPWFWHALFWPVCELELPDGPWLSVLKAERERDGWERAAAALWCVTSSHYIHIYRRRWRVHDAS